MNKNKECVCLNFWPGVYISLVTPVQNQKKKKANFSQVSNLF